MVSSLRWSHLLLVLPAVSAFTASPRQSTSPFRLTSSSSSLSVGATIDYSSVDATAPLSDSDSVSASDPLRVVIAGAGVGGLVLAKALSKYDHVQVQVLEQASEFKRFGGPIQLASNALQLLKDMDPDLYQQVSEKFTVTGDKENGIKDGIRTDWYAKFDLKTPAADRNMPYTGVIDRPDLQEIYLQSLPVGMLQNGDGVESYQHLEDGKGVQVTTQSGKTVNADVLIGADGIWSAVRATMRGTPKKGDASGASYSGYTVFAGELAYDSPDNGQVGYKVYIGPGQYFVITDIGKGNYQWYAFLAREPGSAETEEKPKGTSQYLQDLFFGWSSEIHAILKVTEEHEIEQRDLYDRPPSVFKPWTDGRVALLGDGIHAMMPNLGQGGCQAIEDAYVIAQELGQVTKRSDIVDHLKHYQSRRLVRSAAVQGLSRFASDIIIRGFDTPAKIVKDEKTGEVRFENFNYAGIVTKMLQPILPLFFQVQFNFLYDGWKNEMAIDLGAAFGFLLIGGLILLLTAGSVAGSLTEAGLGLGFGLEALFGAEGLIDLEAISTATRSFFESF